jgi:hypothetical protein
MRRHEFNIAKERAYLRELSQRIVEVKAELAARRFIAVLKKYNPNQPRAPRGTSIGGQWVDAGGGNSARQSRVVPSVVARPKAKAPAPIRPKPLGKVPASGRVAAALSEAIPRAARAGGLPLAVGAIGTSRALGTFDHFTTGRSVTPILRIPFDSALVARPKAPIQAPHRHVGTSEWDDDLDKACEAQYDEDMRECQLYSSMYGRSTKEKANILRECRSTAMIRRSECLTRGGVDKITKELFDGRRQ